MQSCSWIKFSFECVKSEYNVGPCRRAHVVEVFVILNWGMEE